MNIVCACFFSFYRPAAVLQMTYPEFLEGIARVAMLKWEDASSTPKDKIERTIAAVVSLLDRGRC